MKTLTKCAIGIMLFANSLCFARPPECDPGPHGCDNKAFESSVVQIYPFKIGDQKGTVHIVMDKNGVIKTKAKKGEIKSEWKVVGTISKDGRVIDAHGKLLAVLRDTSILEDSAGVPLVRIYADGTFDNGSGVPVRWTKDGTLKQGDSPLDVKLLPANSPARRAASIVFFLSNFIHGSTIEEMPQTASKTMDSANAGKPTGACYISSGAGNSCFSGMTQQGCYKAASNVGGVADWQEGKSCNN